MMKALSFEEFYKDRELTVSAHVPVFFMALGAMKTLASKIESLAASDEDAKKAHAELVACAEELEKAARKAINGDAVKHALDLMLQSMLAASSDGDAPPPDGVKTEPGIVGHG